MRSNGRPRVVLNDAERGQLLDDLDRALQLVDRVEETLTVSAWRAGTNPSEWTEQRIGRLRTSAAELRGQVARTPIEAD